jgi:hypothetical protein
MRTAFACLTAALLLAGCGKPLTAADAAPEQSAVLLNRSDAKEGLRFQRIRLNTDELKPGLDAAGLAAVASNYRTLARRISSRSRHVVSLKSVASDVEGALAYDRSMTAIPARGATLTAIVSEFQGTFKGVAGASDALLGRVPPPPPDDDLVWNPRTGR